MLFGRLGDTKQGTSVFTPGKALIPSASLPPNVMTAPGVDPTALVFTPPEPPFWQQWYVIVPGIGLLAYFLFGKKKPKPAT